MSHHSFGCCLNVLGARCRVLPRSAVAGKLEVEYTSLDELDGILAKIGA